MKNPILRSAAIANGIWQKDPKCSIGLAMRAVKCIEEHVRTVSTVVGAARTTESPTQRAQDQTSQVDRGGIAFIEENGGGPNAYSKRGGREPPMNGSSICSVHASSQDYFRKRKTKPNSQFFSIRSTTYGSSSRTAAHQASGYESGSRTKVSPL